METNGIVSEIPHHRGGLGCRSQGMMARADRDGLESGIDDAVQIHWETLFAARNSIIRVTEYTGHCRALSVAWTA